MAKRKMTFEIGSHEAAELRSALERSCSPIALELASALDDLAQGRASIVSLCSDDASIDNAETQIRAEGIVIDLPSRTVSVLGSDVQLTPKEFDILAFLANNRGVVFSKEQIYRAVWKDDYLLDDSNIMAFIRKIRKKVEPEPDNPRFLLTVWGVGYKFVD